MLIVCSSVIQSQLTYSSQSDHDHQKSHKITIPNQMIPDHLYPDLKYTSMLLPKLKTVFLHAERALCQKSVAQIVCSRLKLSQLQTSPDKLGGL